MSAPPGWGDRPDPWVCLIPLAELRFTGPGSLYPAAYLDRLAALVRSRGVRRPLLVRPGKGAALLPDPAHGWEWYEVVTDPGGYFQAMQRAEIPSAVCCVQPLTDAAVRELRAAERAAG